MTVENGSREFERCRKMASTLQKIKITNFIVIQLKDVSYIQKTPLVIHVYVSVCELGHTQETENQKKEKRISVQ